MPNNRTRVNYAIYENIGAQNTEPWKKTEYCVLRRKNGKMELWGQINVEDTDGMAGYLIDIQCPDGKLEYYDDTFLGIADLSYSRVPELHEEINSKFIWTFPFIDENKKEVGQLVFINLPKKENCVWILEGVGEQVLIQKLSEADAFHLDFSDDYRYEDKQSPWYFRRFDDPLMAAMIYDEQENMSNKFKERYGVTLPEDIPDKMVAILLSIPFLFENYNFDG